MNIPKKSKKGVTLVELILAMAASSFILLAVGMLILGGQKCWLQTYNRNNSVMQVETISATAAFTTTGRKSNKTNYKLYKRVNNTYIQAVPQSSPDEILFGEAVEFRYWDKELSSEFMNTAITATAYILFYFENGELKADYGPYPPGAIDSGGNRIAGADVTTVTLVQNVKELRFSHTAQNMNGDGRGCVKMELTAQNSDTGEKKVIVAATLLRNNWP